MVAGGRQALASTGAPGAKSYLTQEQIQALQAALERGAVARGWETDRWTVPRIRVLIYETTGVWYASLGSLWLLLRRIGFSSASAPSTGPPNATSRPSAPGGRRPGPR